jgi:hypothetical protein
MLEKEPDNACCHCLHSVALFESNFNQAKWLIISHKLSHHLEQHSLVPNMQLGSCPGKQCTSTVLKKVLLHNTIRLTKGTGGFMKMDAIGCYDRLVNNLLHLLLQKLGFSPKICACMGSIWDEVVHHIKTIYGTSDITYGSITQHPLYGPGQGCTCGPPFWVLFHWLSVTSLDPSISIAHFMSACRTILLDVTCRLFISGVTSTYEYNDQLSGAEKSSSRGSPNNC